MFREKIRRHQPSCWLVNTGWSGGPFGEGRRMEIAYSRAVLRAAMTGELDRVPYYREPIFGLEVPTICPGAPPEIMYPQKTWKNPQNYEPKARELAGRFRENFTKYEATVDQGVLAAGPA